MESFEDLVAVVTGAASGIGAGLAAALAASGANLVLADISDTSDTEARARALGAEVISVPTDVTDQSSVDALASATYQTFGKANLLCNNAGVVLFGPLTEISERQWDWILAVNLRGVIHGVNAFLPRMLQQTDARHILNTVSGAGLVASGVMPLGAYTTSKFAAMGYSESLRNELHSTGIGITILCPGSVETGILDAADYTESAQVFRPKVPGAATPSREGVRRMKPSDVAELALDGVRNGQPYVLTHPESFGAIEERFLQVQSAAKQTAARLGL